MPSNPPPPAGTILWKKAVVPAMTAWAKSILGDSARYPMFSEERRFFGADELVARVEWHTWTFRNGVRVNGIFRGVTLYEQLAPAATEGNRGSRARGVDVSHYQGSIDWGRVA